MMRYDFIAAAVCLLIAGAPVNAKPTKQERQIVAMVQRLPSEIEPLIKIEGDEMDPSIKITSKGASQIVSRGLIASQVYENSFLRSYIDKKSGDVTAEIYHSAVYGGKSWNFFNRATYQSFDGLIESKVIKVGSDVSCSRYGCTHYEELVVPIPFTTLEAISAKYNPSQPLMGLKYRLFGQSGETIDEAIPVNEIVAFVAVVNRNRPK